MVNLHAWEDLADSQSPKKKNDELKDKKKDPKKKGKNKEDGNEYNYYDEVL